MKCPYCKSEYEPDWEANDQEALYEEECENCGKVFGYKVEYDPSYYSFELPCSNGEPHKFKKVCDIPEQIAKDMVLIQCHYCDRQETRKKQDAGYE